MIRRLILSLVFLLGLTPIAFGQVVSIKPGSDIAVDLGPPGATACATDTGSCALNALAQRVAQRLTSVIAAIQGNLTVTTVPLATSGGLTTNCRLPSAAGSTNATNCKNAAGRIYNVRVCNVGNGIRRLKLYNKATAPTVGTDVPIATFGLPAGACYDGQPWGSIGEYASAGIGYAMTVNAADADTTAVTAGDFTDLNIDYQ